jgi:hypothetical protein
MGGAKRNPSLEYFRTSPGCNRAQSCPQLPISAKPGDKLIRERLKQIMALYLDGLIIPPFANARNNVRRLEAYFLNLTNLERVSLHEN